MHKSGAAWHLGGSKARSEALRPPPGDPGRGAGNVAGGRPALKAPLPSCGCFPTCEPGSHRCLPHEVRVKLFKCSSWSRAAHCSFNALSALLFPEAGAGPGSMPERGSGVCVWGAVGGGPAAAAVLRVHLAFRPLLHQNSHGGEAEPRRALGEGTALLGTPLAPDLAAFGRGGRVPKDPRGPAEKETRAPVSSFLTLWGH